MTKQLDLSSVKFINLHAHSDYSLQDGIGAPSEHYIETIRKGHCGCCITDHGSYASAFDLFLTKKGAKKDKKIGELFKEKNIESHPIVAGSELYVYDDRLKVKILQTLSCIIDQDFNHNLEILKKIRSLVVESKNNPKYSSLFASTDNRYIDDIMDDKKPRSNSSENKTDSNETNSEDSSENKEVKKKKIDLKKIGENLIRDIDGMLLNPKEEIWSSLVESIIDFSEASIACNSYKYNHITVIAKNKEGHKNLCRLTSEAGLPENFYKRPRISLSRLIQLKEGLIVTTGCFLGMIPQAIHRKTGEEETFVQIFKESFGDDFYIEIHLGDVSWDWVGKDRTWSRKIYNKKSVYNYLLKNEKIDLKKFNENSEYISVSEHDLAKLEESKIEFKVYNEQRLVNERLLELVNKYDMMGNTYITQDSHMPSVDDKEHQDLIIQSDSNNKNGWHFHDAYYIMSVEEMYKKFKTSLEFLSDDDFVQMCENSIKVLDKCKDFKIDQGVKLPKVELDKHIVNTDSELSLKLEQKIFEIKNQYPTEYLIQKVMKELDKDFALKTAIKISLYYNRFDLLDPVFAKRYFYELNSLQLNGYNKLFPYFAIFEDFSFQIDAEKEVKGLGRGSSAGSLCVYSWNITDINSVKKKLSYERFLPKERIGVLYYDFKKYTLAKFLEEKYPNGLDVSVLDYQERFVKLFDSSTKDSFDKNLLSREYEYAYHNPEILAYLFYLKENKQVFEENDSNSIISFLFGVCPEPKGQIKEDVGSMPDIDYDSSSRDFLINYAKKKYGKNKVALVGTYGSLGIKSSVKEILKLKTNLSNTEINAITKMFDKIKFSEEEQQKGDVWIFEKTVSDIAELKNIFENGFKSNYGDVSGELVSEQIKKVLGTKKSWGIHAGGVVLTEDDIIDLVPCHYDEDSECFVTQLDKDMLEKFGFQKMDLLGISTAEIIRDTFKRLEKKGINLFKKLEELYDLEDPQVMDAIFSKYRTLGIFQFNTAGPTDFLRRCKKVIVVPDTPLITSVYRPGPMGFGMHKDLLAIMNGEKEVEKIHPVVDKILEKTYGIIVYQEQVMAIVQQVGLISAYNSDQVRRAMGKKQFDKILPFQEIFIKNAIEHHGIEKDVAKNLWDKMAKFAEYGFNESHAVAYSALSYVCAYLKYYHLEEWVSSVLSVCRKKDAEKDKETFKQFYREYRDIILSPDINLAKEDYEVIEGKIVAPLFSIAKIKEDRARKIIERQPFSSFENLLIKCDDDKILNKTIVEALIFSGSCDSFRPNTAYIKDHLLNDQLEQNEIDFIVSGLNKENKSEYFELADKVSINLPLEEDEINLILKAKFMKSGISKFEFRKKLIEDYYLNIPYKETLDNLNSPDDKVKDKAIKKTGTKDFVASKQHVEEVNKISSGLMILQELDLLRVTTFNYETILNDAIKYHKERTLKYNSIYSVSEAMRLIEHSTHNLNEAYNLILEKRKEAIQTANDEAISILAGELIRFRSVLGEFQTRDIIKDTLLNIYLSNKTAFNKLAVILFLNGGFNIYKGVFANITLKLNSIIDKEAFKILKEVVYFDHDLNFVNTELKVETSIYNYSKFITLLMVIRHGAQFVKAVENSVGLDNKQIGEIVKSLTKLEINKTNIDRIRKKIDSFDVETPDMSLANHLIASYHELPIENLDQEYWIYGVSFKPDKKEKFKKERFKNDKTTTDLNFKMTNDTEEIQVKIFSSEGMSISGSNVENHIVNFHPLAMKGRFNYSPDRESLTFIVSKEQGSIIPLIKQIS